MARSNRDINLEFYGCRNGMALVNRIKPDNSRKKRRDSSFKRREYS